MNDFRAYRDKAGFFQGQTTGEIPEGMIECPPPAHALQRWQGGKWANTPAYEKEMAAQALGMSDKDMIRGIEDLISVLKAKNILSDADLPAELRAKIAERAENRGKM